MVIPAKAGIHLKTMIYAAIFLIIVTKNCKIAGKQYRERGERHQTRDHEPRPDSLATEEDEKHTGKIEKSPKWAMFSGGYGLILIRETGNHN